MGSVLTKQRQLNPSAGPWISALSTCRLVEITPGCYRIGSSEFPLVPVRKWQPCASQQTNYNLGLLSFLEWPEDVLDGFTSLGVNGHHPLKKLSLKLWNRCRPFASLPRLSGCIHFGHHTIARSVQGCAFHVVTVEFPRKHAYMRISVMTCHMRNICFTCAITLFVGGEAALD